MKNIEDVHKNNLRVVRRERLAAGQRFRHKTTGRTCLIVAIHPLYGWVVTEPYDIKQDLSNLNEFERAF